MSDDQYDLLVAELRELSPNSGALDYLGAASKSVRKITHPVRPMLSLRKTYAHDELDAWFEATVENVGDTGENVVVMPKYDGVSCSLVYENGTLVSASTRGNGKVGESIYHLVAGKCVPKKLSSEILLYSKDETLIIRGELLLSRNTFEGHFAGTYANARNCVAGLLGKITPTHEHGLIDFVAFDMFPARLFTLSARLKELERSRMFQVATYSLAERATVRDLLPALEPADAKYAEDGKVIRVDDDRVWEACGSTSHHPNGSIAWKYRTDSKWATITDVVWQVSRTGTITPVLEVTPVVLSGATVTRATLHHATNLEALNLRIKDNALLTRRGGVIPHVEQIVQQDNPDQLSRVVALPSTCPSCGSLVVREGYFLRCAFPRTCADAVIGSLVYFARAVGYDGFGPGLATSAYIEGVLSKPHHLYTFIPSALHGVDGWGKANIAALKAGMPRSMPSWKLLHALGLDGFGKTQSTRVLEHFGSLHALIEWAEGHDADPSIVGIGETMLWKLREGVCDIADELRALLEHVTITDEIKVVGPLSGTSFVFTGRLTDMERSDAQAAVRALGADTPSGVTKTLTYLVVGDLANDKQISKRTKAAKYNASGSNIQIIEEEAFVEILRKHTTL